MKDLSALRLAVASLALGALSYGCSESNPAAPAGQLSSGFTGTSGIVTTPGESPSTPVAAKAGTRIIARLTALP